MSNFKQRRARWVAAICVVGVAALAACQPTKTPVKQPPPGPEPGQNIATYFVIDGVPDGTNTTRATSPFSSPYSGGNGTASQTLNPDGSVTLEVNGTQAAVVGTSGFTLDPFGRLGDLSQVTVQLAAGSNQLNPSLALDVDGDGSFGGVFDQNGNQTSWGEDVIALAGQGLTINDQTSLTLIGAGSGIFSLAQLKSGSVTGIDADTPVAVVIGLIGPAFSDTSATVDSVTVNGTEMLVP